MAVHRNVRAGGRGACGELRAEQQSHSPNIKIAAGRAAGDGHISACITASFLRADRTSAAKPRISQRGDRQIGRSETRGRGAQKRLPPIQSALIPICHGHI